MSVDVEDPNDSYLVPRAYQNELLDKAKQCNSIICLKTGAGKTYIAIMLIKCHQHELRGDYDKDGKRTFFLVPKVPLVTQQAAAIERNTNLKVGRYCGAMGVDLWKADQWNKELISNQVLVMTPQILVNLLNHGFMTLNKINLMIFDECHAATGQSPYCSIMCRYKDFKEKPRILGLTASVIAGKCSPLNVTKKMKDLEKTLYSRIQTASNISEVNRYATKPREVIIEFRSDDPSNNDVKAEFLGVLKVGYQHIEALTPKKTKTNDSSLVETFADILKWFQKMDTSDDNDTCDSLDFSCTPLEMLKSISDILRILGLWCANCMIDKYLEDIDNQIPEAIVDHNVLFQHSLEICQNALQKAKTIYLNHSSHFSERKKLELVTPKMEKLRELLQTLGQHIDRNRNVTEFRGIIFVERRVVAWILTQYLEKLSEVRPLTFGYLHSCYVVGHGSVMCNINAYCMNSQKQDTMLSAFRSGVKNLLIATQVVEEGLDIPKCNVVIRFDLPKNYCSYVQSMGRARAEGALYIMLVPSGECFTLQQDIVVFKIIESEINISSHNRTVPEEEECEEFFNNRMDLAPYYPIGSEGAAVTLGTAVATLYRYCNSLPHDRYTTLIPVCKYYEDDEDKSKIRCIITLPCRTLFLRPAIGVFMSDKKSAKKAAAFKACVFLHQTGELNDNLMPSTSYCERYEGQLGIVRMPKDIPKESPIPGTNKSRHAYEKKIANCFLNSCPEVLQSMYLYSIMIYTDEQESNKSGFKRSFGILTPNSIPEVCAFKLFGKVFYNVKLKLLESCVRISSGQLKCLKFFHRFLFVDVIKVVGNYMEYSPENAAMSFLIVPLKGDLLGKAPLSLDMEQIHRCTSYAIVPDSNDNTDVQKGDVLITQYGPEGIRNRRFYVTEVSKKITAGDVLKDGLSYTEYFESKYDGVVVRDRRQHMVKVDYVSKEFNLLQKSLSTRIRKEQYLIPELCRKFPLNIDSVNQATCLPCILHRLNGLLVAQQLRDKIIVEAKLGPFDVNINSSPMPFLEDCYAEYPVTDELIFSQEKILNNADSMKFGALLFQALTTRSSNNWSDLECLEVIGDSFLKFAVSVFLICELQSLNEGKLSVLRTGMVRNFTLFSHALEKNIPEIVNATMFQPQRMWIPPGFVIKENPPNTSSVARVGSKRPYKEDDVDDDDLCVHGDDVDDDDDDDDDDNNNDGARVATCSLTVDYNPFTHQCIGDKTIADCTEAIIGTVLIFCGQKATLKLLDWLGLKVKPNEYPWKPPSTAALLRIPDSDAAVIYDGLDELEKQLGYNFKDKSFLRQALTHPSYMEKQCITDNYQQLEFLGDAVLDFLVTMHLYKSHPTLSPGDLTDLRSALVDNVTFGYLSVKNGFHKYLLHASPDLFKPTDECIIRMHQLSHPKETLYLTTEDEALSLEDIEVPKVLGDIFESIAGAIFLDCGMSLDEVWKVYHPLLMDLMERYSVELPLSPVRVLFEHFPDAIFKKSSTSENCMYVMEVHLMKNVYKGVGKNKNVAKNAAAKCALRAKNISINRKLKQQKE